MRAQRLLQWGGALSLDEVPMPAPGDGEVLIQVEACGIGLTVLNCLRGDLGNDPADLPRIPGHEIVGTVVEAGDGVPELLIGRRVCAHFYLFCGRCRRCVAGGESLCENLVGNVGVHRDGGYAEFVAIPVQNVVPLPDGLDPVLATAVSDAIATPVHVARRAELSAGDRVVVIAAGGGVGVHMVQVAQLFGAEVLALDAVETKLAYLEKEFGVWAENSVDFGSVDLAKEWSSGADVVIDLLGTRSSLGWAFDALGPGGRLVLLTTFRDVDFPVSPREAVARQVSILGSRYASRAEIDLAARLVASGRVRPVVSRTVGLEDVDAVHEEIRAGRLLGRGATVPQRISRASAIGERAPYPSGTR